jgi:RNA recognition motif-containing protein
MDIFVGNLSFEAKDVNVKTLFAGFGNVSSVVILMRDNKKKPKSRGFGFVQMPDEQQALAAIAALNGKEFMGRVINIEPARPKTEAQVKNKLKKEQPKPAVEVGQGKKTWFSPVFNKPGTYMGGRRTRSYARQRGLSGMPEEARPRRQNQDNPMRWRKKKDQPKPWQKSPGEHKPRKKAEGEARPWKKPTGDAKPWSKSSERPQKSRFKGRRKPGGYKR